VVAPLFRAEHVEAMQPTMPVMLGHVSLMACVDGIRIFRDPIVENESHTRAKSPQRWVLRGIIAARRNQGYVRRVSMMFCVGLYCSRVVNQIHHVWLYFAGWNLHAWRSQRHAR
jgi:hypothetical protein